MEKVLYVCSSPGLRSYSRRILDIMLESEVIQVYAVIFIYNGMDNVGQIAEYEIKEAYGERVLYISASPSGVNRLIGFGKYARQIKAYADKNGIERIHFIAQDVFFSGFTNTVKGKKLYYTVHDVIHHESKQGMLKLLKRYIFLVRRERHLLKSIPFLVTSSRHQYDALRVLFPGKDVFYHDMPDLISRGMIEGAERIRELPEGSYVLFFGRIEQYKGVEYLYNLFIDDPELRKLNLVIAGQGEIYFARKTGQEQGITFVNRFVMDGELNDLFSRALCLVLPYISASQSAVTSLGYHYHVPILSSNIEGLKDTVGDGVSGLLFEPRNEQDLREKLVSLLFDEALYKKICAGMTEYGRMVYDCGRIRSQLESVYLET